MGWLLLKQDLDSVCCDCKAVARLSVLIVFFLFGFLVLIAVGLLASYTGSATGVGRETLSWLLSFVVLCLFEVVKAFTLGYVGGAYVVYPLFGPCVAKAWKFLLA